MFHLTGIIPALLTPFDAAGEVNPAALRELIEFHIAQGVAGEFVCGWSGEGMLLSEAERRLVAETAIAGARGRVPVIVHTGALTTAEAVRLSAHAGAAGADAISVKLPMIYSVGPAGIRQHYRAIAAATTLPLYVYNEPGSASDPFTPAAFRDLCADIPTLAGMKFTSRDLFQMRQFLDLEVDGRRPNVLSGLEELLVGALAMGAHGSVGLIYNLLPRLGVDIYDAFQRGDVEEAQALQVRSNRVLNVWYAFEKAGGLSVFKAMLKRIGIECGAGRPPHAPLTGAQFEELTEALDAAGFREIAVTV